MVHLIVVVTALLTGIAANIESTGSIGGLVKDKSTQEPLPGVNVVIVGTKRGSATNLDGEFLIDNVRIGVHRIKITMIGYNSVSKDITVYPDIKTVLNANLIISAIPVKGVVVSGEKTADKTSVSTQILSGKKLRGLHGIVEDPMKVLHTLPGIAGVTGGEEFAGIICVRGGNPDENLYLLDWAKVHWPWHMGGMKSFFNSELIENIELLTGGFPAKYGDALSSVVNVTTRAGKRDRIHSKANLRV